MINDLEKRDCRINIKLVPYGAGWTDVYLDISTDNLYFVISSAIGENFWHLLRALYHLYPENSDPEYDDFVDYYDGVCERTESGYEITKIVERASADEMPCICQDIPYKAEFEWDEEGSSSRWVIMREPNTDTDFDITIDITINRVEVEHYSYKVRYKDFCYAVAKACTEVLKSHGIYGYHYSVYNEKMDLVYLLFLKSVALDNFEVRELTKNGEKNGYSSSFEKELELLLFDM